MKLFWVCSYTDQKCKKPHLRLLNGNFLYVFDYLVLTALQIILLPMPICIEFAERIYEVLSHL